MGGGAWDDDDFTAAEMCCVCGGGAPLYPLPPPPPLPPTADMISTAVQVAGDVSDFTPSIQLELREKVANEVGVGAAA